MKILTWLISIGIFVFAAYYAITAYMEQVPHGGAPALPQLLGNGEHLGFIHGVGDGNATIQFDDAVWLSGKEGEDAAIEAGMCTEETRKECLPNDFFIKNDTVKDRQVFVHPDGRVIMQTFGMEETGEVAGREIGLTDFAALINDPALHWRLLPYRITVLNGVVTGIEEVYIP